MATKQYLSTTRPFTPTSTSKLSQIVDIPDFRDEGQTFKIEAVASIIDYAQKFWYMCCNHCQRAINAKYQSQYTCLHCNKVASAFSRCRIDVQLQDSSGAIMEVIFGAKTEKLFSITPVNLIEHINEDGLVDKHCFPPSEQIHMLIIKASRHEHRGETTVKFTIIHVGNGTTST